MPDGVLIGWRHHLHAHPELSRMEAATASFVAARLAEMGIAHETGIGGHGVVATIERGAGPRVALRADMDALPIEEGGAAAWRSTSPGVMHACGHDGHMAAMLGAARALASDPDWSGTVRFVFQPAEEGAGGADAMIADGLFRRFPIDRIFGWHNWPGVPVGTVVLHDGPVMAAGCRIEFSVDGRAAHAAQPHFSRDPMVAAAHLLIALQSVASRFSDPLDPVVFSLCTMRSSSLALNQIGASAHLGGTVRALRDGVLRDVVAHAARIADGIALAMDLRITTTTPSRVAAVVNTPGEADFATGAARAAGMRVWRDRPADMTSEDFSAYLQHVPGCFAWIGNGDSAVLHSPDYDFCDAILPDGVRYLTSVAKAALRP